ncbi:hypothetical protein [Sinorhizobium fredii]|uniref:hypothetical protein n=1 Tax=Rhizobium fredii TaxID=380 RepID=UPI0035169785
MAAVLVHTEILSLGPNGDRELNAVMRQYFAAKAELESLKEQLEVARQAAGEAIGMYDPRQNAEHPADLQRSHRLKGDDEFLGA